MNESEEQVLIATWRRIAKALACSSKRTAKVKCKVLGITVAMIKGVAHVDAAQVRSAFYDFAERQRKGL